MSFNKFLYRQRQRINYHISRTPVVRRIAEINRYKKVIDIQKGGYLINDLQVILPRVKFDFIFQPNTFDLFINIFKNLHGKYKLSSNRLFFEFDDIRIEITNRSELFIINEIFINRCYQFLLPRNETVHVVDIGMNVGLASLFFAGLSCVKKVHGYEPFSPTFLQAKQNFIANPIRAAKIDAYNFGLGLRKDEISAAYNPANTGMNTSLASGRSSGRTETLRIRPAFETMDSLFNVYPDEKFVLKIDTEGAEYPIFESLFRQQLSDRVRGVMLEWHFLGPHKLEEALLKNDFTIASFRLNSNSGLIYAFR